MFFFFFKNYNIMFAGVFQDWIWCERAAPAHEQYGPHGAPSLHGLLRPLPNWLYKQVYRVSHWKVVSKF